jgi:hypothetical protein
VQEQSAFLEVIDRQARPQPPAPPVAVVAPPDVLVPTEVRVRSTAGLDAAALDAANAGPLRYGAPPPGGSGGRRSRKFGGR